MKWPLLVALLCLPAVARPAPTATSTSTSTATNTYAEKFGEKWKSVKGNEDLLKDKAMVDEATKDGNLSQEDAYIMTSNTLYSCVEVAASGRDDEVCKSDPNHPECVGVARALANATNCLEYFTPATLGCKRYGTAEYSLDEWIAVGDQFQSQMVDCANRKENIDKTDNAGRIESLTEMIGAKNYMGKLASGPNMKGSSLAPDSKISGSIKPDMEVSSVEWESLASRIKDGASYLGYQDGDILRASLKGESFSSIVQESPFAQKLNYENRAKLEEGLADSKMISQRVVQAHREKNEPVAATENPEEQGEIRIGANYSAHPAESGEKSATGGAIAPANEAQAAAKPKAADATAKPAGVNEGSRAMLESERLEAVAQAAALARSEKRAYRAPASLAQSRVEDLLDTTLFQRISQTYRRRGAGMKILDSRSGDLIRSIEKPEIFRSL